MGVYDQVVSASMEWPNTNKWILEGGRFFWKIGKGFGVLDRLVMWIGPVNIKYRARLPLLNIENISI
jgi:hypothetical protein